MSKPEIIQNIWKQTNIHQISLSNFPFLLMSLYLLLSLIHTHTTRTIYLSISFHLFTYQPTYIKLLICFCFSLCISFDTLLFCHLLVYLVFTFSFILSTSPKSVHLLWFHHQCCHTSMPLRCRIVSPLSNRLSVINSSTGN